MMRSAPSERAIREYLLIAARIAARCTDEELGMRPEDYAEDVARYCPAEQRMPHAGA